jgi:hypothetical protein
LSPKKGEGITTFGDPLFSRRTSSLEVITAAEAAEVLPISVNVRLAALFFPKGAIVAYLVLFLTLERG